MDTHTYHRIAKFISSLQMESSEIKESVINLGEALVEELGLETGVDTLSRWMAHYVAEQITAIENTTGVEKDKAERRCFETVLKLWHHKSVMPDGHRPFESFESILRALDKLDPDNQQSFYFPNFDIGKSKASSTPKDETDEVQKWIDCAFNIDSAARVLIKIAFEEAAKKASDEKAIFCIKNATKLLSDNETSIIIRLLSASEDEKEVSEQERIKTEREKIIRSKIEKLDAFVEISNSLRAALINELEVLPEV